MRRLLVFGVFLALIYSGIWGALAYFAPRLPEVLAQQGIILQQRDTRVSGYPARLLVQMDDPVLQGQGWRWQAAEAQVSVAGLRPWAVTLDLPGVQMLDWGDGPLQISGDPWQGDLALVPGPALALGELGLRLGRVTAGEAGLAQASLRVARAGAASYDLHVQATDIALPAAWVAAYDPAGQLGPVIARLDFAGQAVLDRPIDRHLRQDPRLTALRVADAQVTWGAVTVLATADLRFDAAGVPEGDLTLETDGWDAMLDLLVSAGVVSPNAAPTIRGVAGFFAGQDNVLRVPVTFADGVMLISGLPAGPAPRLP
jgi:hypothetical protein